MPGTTIPAGTANPNGDEIVQTGVSGLGGFFNALGNIAITGIAARVDMELTKEQAKLNPDSYRRTTEQQPPPRPFEYAAGDQVRDVVANLTPLQWGGLAVAFGLTVFLIKGA